MFDVLGVHVGKGASAVVATKSDLSEAPQNSVPEALSSCLRTSRTLLYSE